MTLPAPGRWGGMALGAVLLALTGALALWLVVDAGRERHRLRARLTRTTLGSRRRRTFVGPVSSLVPPPGGVTG